MSDPRSIRTNNPGAMNYGPFAQRWGATGSDGRLAIFPDQQSGFAAMGGLLDTYQSQHGLNTVSGIINRWAPRGVDNNSTDSYVATVARKLGVDPNQPLTPEHRAPLMEAMASYEAGRPVSMGGSAPQQAARASPQSPPQPVTALQGSPAMAEQQQPGFLDRLAGGFANPLTQGGLGLLLASAQGGNMANGMFSGVQSGLAAQQQQQAMLRRQQQQLMLQRMAQDQNFAKSAGIPPELMQLAVAGEDPSMVANFIAKRPDRELEQRKLQLGVDSLAETSRQNKEMFPLEKMKAEAQVKSLQAKEPEQELMKMIMGNLVRQQQGASPGAQMPKVQPQSFESGGAPAMAFPVSDAGGAVTPNDPNLIRTQAAAPQQEELIDVPGLGKTPKSTAEALQFFMSKDRGSVVGEAIKKNDLAKETRNKLDEKELNTTEQLSRLSSIASGFDPSYLTAGEQLKQYGMSWASYLGAKLPPEQQAQRAKFVSFQQDTLSNLNNYIKEITGAAMTDSEAKRLMASMPNMQDDPEAFVSKLNNTRAQATLSIARYRYLRNNGFKGQPWDVGKASGSLSLDGMQKIIHERRDAIIKEIRDGYPDASQDQIRGAVKARISQEFGIDA